MSRANVFEASGRHQLMVQGNAGDTLDLADGSGTAGWTKGSTVNIGSIDYDVWNHNNALATLYVTPSISVTSAVADIDDAGSIANITGTATQGQTLTAGAITDMDGGVTDITYQWKAGGVNIATATNSTYTLTQAEVGKVITVVATYTDNQGTGKTVTSAATSAVADIDDAGTITDITGTATQGQTLTAGAINDMDGGVTGITYQWKADGADIADATSSTYTLSQAEVGKIITVVATYTDSQGTGKTVTSAATSAVADIDDAGSIANIIGTATQKQTLTAGAINDMDGGVADITYQWKAGGVNIAGATSSTYILTQAEVGKIITVVATYTDSQGTGKTVTSAATSAVADIDDAGTIADITGTAKQGQTLSAGAITDMDGGITGITYQWKANGVNIATATSSTHTLTQAEVGKTITVVATYKDNLGIGKTVTSAATGAVAQPPVPINLSAIAAGTGGFVMNGQTADDRSGWSVSSAGDVNGDGLADLIVGAWAGDPNNVTNAGTSYVVFGQTGTTTIDLSAIAGGTGGFVINGESIGNWSGRSVSGAGDVNGDGLADLLVGVRWSDPVVGEHSGRAYVVFGQTGTTAINLSAIAAGTGGFVMNGQGVSDHSGYSVSSAGDVNGDGLADLIVGAPYSDPATGTNAGRTYVVFGKTGTTTIDLSAIAAATGGFVMNGQGASDQSGYSVSSAGDVNGDGLADLIIGANFADAPGKLDIGKSYVVFGQTGTTAINLSAIAAGTGGFVMNGQGVSDQSGYSVSSAGDVNGDGLADLIVGAPYSDPAAGGNAGRSYVVFGKTDTTAIDLSAIAAATGGFVINGQLNDNTSGFSVSSVGDVNGDGLADLIVGAPGNSPSGISKAGSSYVVFGQTGTTAINLSAIAVGIGGFVMVGHYADINIGHSVSSAGDVNGDGLADLLLGSPALSRSYVIFGSTDGAFVSSSVDQLGTGGNDTLASTGNQTLVGGAGNDILTGHGTNGADILYGGAGNDTFVLSSANAAALQAIMGEGGNTIQLSRVDGGSGIDTLRLTGGASLDLTAIKNVGAGGPDGLSRIESIEKIDMATDAGAQTLRLSLQDVLDMTGMNLFNTSNGWANTTNTPLGASVGRHQLVINGGAEDGVELQNMSAWGSSAGQVSNNGLIYDVYNHNTALAQLLVQSGVRITEPVI